MNITEVKTELGRILTDSCDGRVSRKAAYDQKNKELAELLGICWHEPVPSKFRENAEDFPYFSYPCSCGEEWRTREFLVDHCNKENPNFTTDSDKVLLLRTLRQKGKWQLFANDTLGTDADGLACWPENRLAELIDDQTGKLADLVLEWMRRERG